MSQVYIHIHTYVHMHIHIFSLHSHCSLFVYSYIHIFIVPIFIYSYARHVLTSAQCIPDDSEKVTILLGKHDLTENEEGQEEFKIMKEDVTIHELFKKGAEKNFPDYDVAILKLPRSIEFSKTIKPVCFPADEDETYEGMKAIAMGWGKSKI